MDPYPGLSRLPSSFNSAKPTCRTKGLQRSRAKAAIAISVRRWKARMVLKAGLYDELFHECRLNRMHYKQRGLFVEGWSWQ